MAAPQNRQAPAHLQQRLNRIVVSILVSIPLHTRIPLYGSFRSESSLFLKARNRRFRETSSHRKGLGLGSRFQGLGSSGLGCEVQDFGFIGQSLGFVVQG